MNPFTWINVLHHLRQSNRKLDLLLERINAMSIDFSDLSNKVDAAILAVAAAGTDKAALAQAQADLAAAQSTVNDLAAKLKAALPAA